MGMALGLFRLVGEAGEVPPDAGTGFDAEAEGVRLDPSGLYGEFKSLDDLAGLRKIETDLAQGLADDGKFRWLFPDQVGVEQFLGAPAGVGGGSDPVVQAQVGLRTHRRWVVKGRVVL